MTINYTPTTTATTKNDDDDDDSNDANSRSSAGPQFAPPAPIPIAPDVLCLTYRIQKVTINYVPSSN